MSKSNDDLGGDESSDQEVDFIPVAAKTDLGEGEVLWIEVEGNRIVIFNVDDKFYAMKAYDRDEEELAEGQLDGLESKLAHQVPGLISVMEVFFIASFSGDQVSIPLKFAAKKY